jgi:LCP family protein required for cell wall assembly
LLPDRQMATRPARGQSQGWPYALVAAALLILIGAVIFLIVLRPGEPTPSPNPEVTPDPTPTPDSALLDRRLTVVLLGVDLSEARVERGEPPDTDTIMLASVSADQSELVLVSLPRDTVDIPRPDGTLWERKVNAMYREEGPAQLVAALETLFDVEIDGYVAIDMEDFIRLVDELGGIEVDAESHLRDPIVDLDLEPGRHELDGGAALAFVRTRVDDDYGRQERNQRAVLGLLERLVEREAPLDPRSLLDRLDSLETDLPLDELPALVEIARRAADAAVIREVLGPPRFITFEGDVGDGRGYILVPDPDEIGEFVQGLVGD